MGRHLGEYAILAGAAVLWLWFALQQHGVFWPDEIFQSVEQAHRLIFGYGFVPWEYQLGARSWLFPALLAAPLGAAAAVGGGSMGLVVAAKIFMILIGLVGLAASMRLARHLGGPASALLAGAFGAALPLHLVLAGRAFSELAAASALVVAAALVTRPEPPLTTPALRLAGALVALATAMRPASGVLALGLLVLAGKAGRGRGLRRFLEGAIPVGLAAGLLDWITWGAPFHALYLYLRYNLFEGHAADYGTAPVGFYLSTLASSTGLALGPLALGLGLAGTVRAARPWLVLVVVELVVLSALPHKELRFLLPVAPLLLALAGLGCARLLVVLPLGRHGPRAAGLALAAVMGVAMVMRARGATYGDFGRLSRDEQAATPAGRASDGFNRLLLRAGAAPDLCGLAVAGAHIIWLGGYTYLHRNVPFFELDPPTPEGSPAANYVLAPSRWSRPTGAVLVEQQAEAALYRFPHSCAAPPKDAHLFELPASLRDFRP